jgi:hypothetical protein
MTTAPPPPPPFALPPPDSLTLPGSLADVPTITADLRHVLAEIATGVDTISANVDAFLSPLPDFLGADLRRTVQQLRQLSDDVTSGISDRLALAGDPAVLRDTGGRWVAEIGGGVADFGQLTRPDGTKAANLWTGVAADAYRDAVLPQHDALAAIVASSATLRATLNDLATAISAYWLAVSQAALSFAAAIIAAAFSSAGGPVVVIGIGFAVAAGVTAVGMINSANAAMTTISDTTASRTADIDTQVLDDFAFPAGAWPRSANPISSDGSISDGDDTDWHLR